jgi:hypothetical protein
MRYLRCSGHLERLSQNGAHFSRVLALWPAPETTLQATIAKEQHWVQESYAYLDNTL